MSIRRLRFAGVLGIIALFACCHSAIAQSVPPATPSAEAPREYILGPEDVIEVSVLGRTDFVIRAKIAPDGSIQLPYLGTVHAADRTPTALREEITKQLEKGGYFSRPVLSVNIVSAASRYVTVLGSVGTPGMVAIDRPLRVSELLARVGGVKEDAADYVILRSVNGPERRFVIKSLATGDTTQDPYVSPGDKLYAPRLELFYISGQIKTPGAFPLTSDLTFRMALGRGGGLTDSGSEGRIKVTRHGQKLGRVDLDAKVEPGDVIVVGERLF